MAGRRACGRLRTRTALSNAGSACCTCTRADHTYTTLEGLAPKSESKMMCYAEIKGRRKRPRNARFFRRPGGDRRAVEGSRGVWLSLRRSRDFYAIVVGFTRFCITFSPTLTGKLPIILQVDTDHSK